VSSFNQQTRVTTDVSKQTQLIAALYKRWQSYSLRQNINHTSCLTQVMFVESCIMHRPTYSSVWWAEIRQFYVGAGRHIAPKPRPWPNVTWNCLTNSKHQHIGAKMHSVAFKISQNAFPARAPRGGGAHESWHSRKPPSRLERKHSSIMTCVRVFLLTLTTPFILSMSFLNKVRIHSYVWTHTGFRADRSRWHVPGRILSVRYYVT